MLIRWHYRSDRLFFLTSTFPIKIINTKLDNNSNWHCFENRVDRKIVVVRSIFSQCRFSIIEISFFRGLQLIRNSWKFKKFNPLVYSNYIFHLSWAFQTCEIQSRKFAYARLRKVIENLVAYETQRKILICLSVRETAFR